MKKIVIIFFVFFALQSYSQNIFEIEWYLFDMNIDGQSITIPENDEIPFVAANFINDSPDFFETGACNYCSGEVTINDYQGTMVFDNFGCTLSDCFDPENQPFDNLYSSFFMQNTGNSIDYNILIIDGEGTYPDEYILSLVAENGDVVYYTDLYNLSTPDFIDYEIVLFPNPTQDYFTVSSTTENEFSITIYEISGKEVLSQLKSKNKSSINIQNLKSGIYFVSIKDENENISIKRLIKR